MMEVLQERTSQKLYTTNVVPSSLLLRNAKDINISNPKDTKKRKKERKRKRSLKSCVIHYSWYYLYRVKEMHCQIETEIKFEVMDMLQDEE